MSHTELRNFIRERLIDGAKTDWSLATLDGQPFPALLRFSESLKGEYPYNTRRKYVGAVCKFLDYLWEAGAFSGELSSAALAKVVSTYSTLAHLGSREVLRRAAAGEDKVVTDWLAPIASALDWPSTDRDHMGNSIAAINHFLRMSTALAREAKERGELLGIDVSSIRTATLPQFELTTPVSSHELSAMRQASMLGSIVKVSPKLSRPGRLRGPRRPGRDDFDGLDFPIDYVEKLVDSTKNLRDRALWLTQATTGIRPSEATNMLLEDIDFLGRKIFVRDPHKRRFPVRNEKAKFKGRTTAETVLHPRFSDHMFDALREYIDKVYVPCYDDGELQYLFQCTKEPWLGRPLALANESSTVRSFAVAAKRCGAPVAPNQRSWTPKSLRHAYGVYMLNDYPVDPEGGMYGMTLSQVQLAMGHADIRSTQTYARVQRRKLVELSQKAEQRKIEGWWPSHQRLAA